MEEKLANLGVDAPYLGKICERWVAEGLTLDVVDLNDNNFGVPGAQMLARYLPQLRIKTLKIKNNNVMSEGAAALFATLKDSTITTLDITDNFVDAAALSVLANALPPTLENLDVGFNRLDGTSAPHLAALCGLETIKIWQNQLGSGADVLLAALESQQRRPNLDIRFNNLTATQNERFRRHYKACPEKLVIEASDLPPIRTVRDLIDYPQDLTDIAGVQFAQLRAEEELPPSLPDYQPHFDRYPHIRCLPTTQVRQHGETRYHANYITIGTQRFIAAQGPLGHTVGDFVAMVADLNIPLVVALGPATDPTGRSKWIRYWPDKVGERLEVLTSSGEKLRVSLISETLFSASSEEGLLERQIRVQRPSGTYIFRQLHMEKWADLAGPTHAAHLRNLIAELGNVKTAVIHCSAGVGRTGTLLFCLDIWRRLNAAHASLDKATFLAMPLPLAEWLSSLRRQRVLLVQQPAQYLFCLRWAQKMIKTAF